MAANAVERASERQSLDAEVTMRRLGKANYRVRVLDLSPEGCRVEFVERPRVGEPMLIRFDGLEALDAEVCWVEGFCGGVRFGRAMHAAVFDGLAARLGG